MDITRLVAVVLFLIAAALFAGLVPGVPAPAI